MLNADTAAFISSVFAHPFVLILAALFLGKLFVLKDVLAGRVVDLKLKTISKVINIRNLLDEISIYHDQIVYTLLDAKKTKSEHLVTTEMISGTLDKIADRLNNVLPIQKKALDTEIRVYFEEDKTVGQIYRVYGESLQRVHQFVIDYPKRSDKLSKVLHEFPEFQDEELRNRENELVREIQNADVIITSMTKGRKLF